MRGDYSHQFPPAIRLLTADEADAFVNTMRSGTEAERNAARERLIEGFTPVLLAAVAQHIRLLPRQEHLRDDLVSVGALELVKIVDRLAGNECDHAFPYVVNGIRWALRNVYDDGIGGITPANRRKLRKRGGVMPTSRDLTREEMQHGVEDFSPSTLEYREDHPAEMLEEILVCCRDEIDKQIVHLRMAGHTPKEIAKQLGYGPNGHSNVSKRLREIFAKLEARRLA